VASRPHVRTVRLPRTRPLVEPISSVEGEFFRSAGFYVRLSLIAALALGVFGVLGLRLWSLEVLQGPRYVHLARAQTLRYVDLPTARGAIVDIQGRPLADSEGELTLTADPATLGRVDRRGVWRASADGRWLLGRVARTAAVSRAVLIRRIRQNIVKSPYAPAVVLRHLPRSLSFFFDERARAFPGFHVTVLPERRYPQGAFGSEFLGLLGEVSAGQLKDARYRDYKPGEVIGQSGIEATYDRYLNGGLERARVVVDSRGRAVGPLRVLNRKQPSRVLKLTIDAQLQRAAERAIIDGIGFAQAAGHTDANAGAAVVIDPRDGSIYALASYPHFNQVAATRDSHYLGRLLDPSSGSLLLDRATQGIYPTGSTFKPIVAEAALAGGLINPYSILPCTGSLTVGNVVFHNVEPGINAPLNLEQALSISCDTWFYRLGTMFYAQQQTTGSLGMQLWARRLGLGPPTGFDVPGEAAGVVPTPNWLRATFRASWERIWYEGSSVNLSIGQGYLAVTPLQLAVAYSALANGGTVVRPHVGRSVLTPSGELVERLRFPARAHYLLPSLWAIHDALYSAAHVGTSAAIFANFPVPVAGKTGTAQTPYGSDHSWYASWAPANNPRVVVVVLIEHGGFGAEAAAPAAREIYSAFFGLDASGRHRSRHY
jgi:penicillin-binding protein 2